MVQRKAVRFIYGVHNRHASVSELLNKAQLSTLSTRNTINRLKLLFQIIHGMININRDKYISYSARSNTRSQHPYYIIEPLPRNNVFQYSFFPRTFKDWNNLPAEITSSSSLISFLDSVRKHFNVE